MKPRGLSSAAQHLFARKTFEMTITIPVQRPQQSFGSTGTGFGTNCPLKQEILALCTLWTLILVQVSSNWDANKTNLSETSTYKKNLEILCVTQQMFRHPDFIFVEIIKTVVLQNETLYWFFPVFINSYEIAPFNTYVLYPHTTFTSSFYLRKHSS